MSEFREYFVRAGILAWPALLSAIYIFVTGIVLLLTTKRRRTFYIYLLFTFLPIIFGAIGTFIEFNTVKTYIESEPGKIQDTLEFYKNEIWIPLKFSVYISIPLFVTALLGIYKTKNIIRK